MSGLSKAALGFLTVMNDPAKGLFGGYLLLNPTGRPVEFHCTAPVRPNRAQQILYGPTLEPFLYGEQIAKTLIEKSKILPRVVCVDQWSIICVRPMVSVPVLMVESASADSELTAGNEAQRSDRIAVENYSAVRSGHSASAPFPAAITQQEFLWKEHRLRAAEEYSEDIGEMKRCLEELQIGFQLLEPFERIREAIAEAQKAC